MPRYLPEPPHLHATPARIGVLLVNLGTPDAPTAKAVKRYLAEFLADPRVVEIPRPIWLAILHGIILQVRPRRSAAKYASIWSAEGSPLRVHTERQAQLLSQALAHPRLRLAWAMRYGNPSIPAALDQLHAEGCSRILILPLYPQYAASTTATAFDVAGRWMAQRRNAPALRMVRNFHDDPGYIAALAARVREHWQQHGRGERLVMSFHGLPRYTLDKGDPYFCECHKTGRLLAEALGLGKDQWLLTFQSRFGRARWLEPYTEPTLERLAGEGLRSVDVVCPGFVSDCLETLEEIAMECRHAFVAAGGERFHYIDCLNERTDWIAALQAICLRELSGWPLDEPLSATAQEATRLRALELGASA
jgi:ferrochelatase